MAGDQRSRLLESMLRLCAKHLVEVLFKRVPPLRAFGPPVGMTAKGGLQNRRVGRAARGMGFATEGTEAIRVSQVYSVVSVILCGLSCPCVLFSLSVGVRLALGGMATQSVAMGRRMPPCIARTCPRERGHATRRCWSGRAWICHPDSPNGWPYHRHSERRGAKQSEAPRIEEPILQRRAATPLMLLRDGVERLVGCVMALSAWRSTLTPMGEHVAAPRRVPCGSAV